MIIKKTNVTVGVIVGRFQEPELHPGHRYLIDYALKRHENVLIVLGVSYTSTDRNPLSFAMRKGMIESAYPGSGLAVIASESLPSSHKERSRIIDERIRHVFPGREAIVYGSRDSFLGTYHGAFLKKKVPTVFHGSATDVRKKVRVVNSLDFRRGVIYEVNHRKPISYPAVDVAIVNDYQVLLVSKADEEGKLRFPGVFFDPQLDESYERAAARCAHKEISGIATGYQRIIGSRKIEDWRYSRTRDGIVTLLVFMRFLQGKPRPGRGVDGVSWVNIHELPSVLVNCHLPLGDMLKKNR
jgi:bifunctional NMN adenylyltransferase/nudix hydrolase